MTRTTLAPYLASRADRAKTVRQRGASYLIALIPLSLFFLWNFHDLRLWGLICGTALLVTTASLSLHPWIHFASLIVAGVWAYTLGYRIDFVTHPQGGFFYPQGWSWLFTIGWIVAVSQGLFVAGQLDSTEKLLTKILFVAGNALLLISLWQGQFFSVMLLLTLLGAVVWLRARAVPVGQWSRAVGYSLALAAISGLVKTTASVALLAPLIALGLPFTSTLSIVYSQRLPFAWLDGLKIGRSTALFCLYAFCSYASVLAFLATRLPWELWIGVLAVTASGVGLMVWAALRLRRVVAGMKKIVLFGTPLDRVSLDEAVEKIEDFIATHQRALVCTPDTTAILRAQRDRQLREAYAQAHLVTPDGIGLVWAARLLGAPLRERVSGIDLLERLFSQGRQLKAFLLGAAPGVAERAAQRLTERYPNLQIVGTQHGYFPPEENEHVLKVIRQVQPDMVLIGLGVPRQERWMLENRQKLDVPVMMGVGGCFDVWAGRLRRAPQRWRQLGLEWFYRFLQEPRRLGRTSAILLFIAQVYLLKAARIALD